MVVFRISRTEFASDLSGEGARLFGGRWNKKEYPCIYTAASRALALLEYTVNVSIDEMPLVLSMLSLEIPDDIITIDLADLPDNWNESPAPAATKDIGTKFLINGLAPILKLPSVIIPQEFNYLLNTKHALSKEFKIVEINEFFYDPRIKT